MNQTDLKNILAALRPTIYETIHSAIAARRRAAKAKKAAEVDAADKPAQYARSRRLSEFKSERRTVAVGDLDQRLDALEQVQADRYQKNSALAAEIAAEFVAARRIAGERLDFQKEQRRILGELETAPGPAQARYSKEIARSQSPTRYAAKIPARGAPPVYTSLGDIAGQLAEERIGSRGPGFNAERQKILRELIDAKLAGMTDGSVAALYGGNAAEGEIITRACHSISDRASDIAVKRCRSGRGTFREHFRDALNELREQEMRRISDVVLPSVEQFA